ncbi:MAG: T9SS type A sorting domain-containing protein [Saprospiraceae bacterium]|nr:T9SS type A sorting domain-containing protein [Saprospiraceae bacterium]
MFKTQSTQTPLFLSPKVIAFLSILILNLLAVTGDCQSVDPFGIKQLSQIERAKTRQLFYNIHPGKQSEIKGSSIIADLNPDVQMDLMEEYHPLLKISLPQLSQNGSDFLFTEYNFYTEDFNVNLISDQGSAKTEVNRGLHFKGIPTDGSRGFASLSVFTNAVYGSYTQQDGKLYTVTPLNATLEKSVQCLITDESKLNWAEMANGCHTDDYRDYMGSQVEMSVRSSDQCKRIEISIDVDYDLYLKLGKNTQAVSNYVTGLFNNVHTLFRNEGISIALAQLNIHVMEDNFTHMSASSDLESFRKKYANTNKTVRFLLSGYSKNGKATLGGIAYINTVCNSTYSYAYGNVLGSYEQSPAYSWDVFVVAHELGHTFGSRHTHACVWGPQKNKAIDNCAKLEGSCAAPGLPKKGSMMSYCYQTGMPGIDFLEGFGTEPGALIRSTIQAASCLKSSSPEGRPLDTSNTSISANVECSDGIYTHYFFDNNTIDATDDILILSIKNDTFDLGNLRDSSLVLQLTTTKNYGSKTAAGITAAYVAPDQSLFSVNKFWTIKTKSKITKSLKIQFLLSSKDIADLSGSAGSIDINKLIGIQIKSPGSIDPETNHQKATKELTNFIPVSNLATENTMTLLKQADGNYMAEITTRNFENTAFGIFQAAENPFVSITGMKAQSENTNSTIEFQTQFENNCSRFVLERSLNNNTFDSLISVSTKGNSTVQQSYVKNFTSALSEKDVLRIKAVSAQGKVFYSPAFAATVIAPKTESLSLYPNPVTQGRFTFEYHSSAIATDRIVVSILDSYGKTLRSYSYNVKNGKNVFNMYTFGLKTGLYYLRIISSTESVKAPFNISQ